MSKEWIPWHGGPCPVAKGTLIDVRESGCPGVIEFFNVAAQSEGDGQGSWLWRRGYTKVIAYRICDDGEEAKRTARMEEFRRIADEALVGDKPVKAPVKERVE